MKIIAYDADPTSTVAFYRSSGPLGLLRRQMKDLRYQFSSTATWAMFKEADVAYFQRPCTEDHVKIIDLIKKMRLPLIVDYDDLLTDVPSYNPAFHSFMKPSVRESVMLSLKAADVVTVSTPHLKSCWTKFADRIEIVPNAWDDSLYFTDKISKPPNKNLRIAWRGSATHSADLDIMAEGCLTIAQAMPDIHWFFLGDEPWFARRLPPSNCHVFCKDKPVSVVEFPSLLRELNIDIAVNPLADNDFNRSKSSNAWMEWSYAGAIVVAPQFPEWIRPGVINYPKDGFTNTLWHTIENIDSLKRELNSISVDYINENLLLSVVNRKRAEILQSMFS